MPSRRPNLWKTLAAANVTGAMFRAQLDGETDEPMVALVASRTAGPSDPTPATGLDQAHRSTRTGGRPRFSRRHLSVGFLLGLLVGEGHFGGDGRQPQVTLRMHVRHEETFEWLRRTYPGSALYGPYHHGGRSYYQWSARGRYLREYIVPPGAAPPVAAGRLHGGPLRHHVRALRHRPRPAIGRRRPERAPLQSGAMLAPSAQTWRLLSAAPPREVFAVMEQMIGTTPYRYEVVGESEARIVEHRRRAACSGSGVAPGSAFAGFAAGPWRPPRAPGSRSKPAPGAGSSPRRWARPTAVRSPVPSR